MKTLMAKDAKYGFSRLIDLAHAEPVTVVKHGRDVILVIAVEKYERLVGLANKRASTNKTVNPKPLPSGKCR